MSQGVEFDEEPKVYSKPNASSGDSSYSKLQDRNQQTYSPIAGEPKMIQWLIGRGYVKTPFMGRNVLLVVVAINISIAFFIIKNFF